MARKIQKTGFLGNQKITYLEEDANGEYSYMDGEWIWIKNEH